MLRMTAQQMRAMKLINEWLEIIKDTYEAENLDGWLEYADWGDIEYRVARYGEYRGVVLYTEEDDNGLIVEIDTARETITILDDDYNMIMIESLTDNKRAQAVTRKLANEFETKYYDDDDEEE